MKSQTLTFDLSLPFGSNLPLGECSPIDDAPARSTDCIGFGPHNVLQVCSRWSVSFYLANLLSPACQCQIRNHPLCHRTELESVEAVVSAKWSTSLLPEVFYPASARVCVQTTSNLVVYRVTRHGATQVEASCGIGISCCCGSAKDTKAGETSRGKSSPTVFKREKPSAAATSATHESSDKTVEPTQTTTAALRKRKSSAKEAKIFTATNTKKGAAPAIKKQRRRRSSSSSDDKSESESVSSSSSSCSDSSSSSSNSDGDGDGNRNGSSGGVSRSTAETKASTTCPVTAKRSRPRGTAAETAGRSVNLGKKKGWASEAASSASHQHTPNIPVEDDDTVTTGNLYAALLDYAWLSNDDLAVLTTRGLHVVSFYGDLSDDKIPQTRDLPPPAYTWGSDDDTAGLDFRLPTPVCFTPISTSGFTVHAPTSAAALAFLQRTLVVASPYLLRVLHVSSVARTPGSPANVQLMHYMEVPSLTSFPGAVCAVAVSYKLSTFPSTAANAAEVVVFLSAPSLVLRGRFVLSIPTSAGLEIPPARSATWTADAQFGPTELIGEVSLRGLIVAPFAAEVPATLVDVAYSSSPPPTSTTLSSSADKRLTTAINVCTAVLGVGERSLVQYQLFGPSCVTLFQCPLLVGRSEMPPDKCAAVAGVALHPAGSVAVVAVQSGHSSHEPVHLWPTSVDGTESWLRRFVEFSGVLRTERAKNKLRDHCGAGTDVDAAAYHDESESLCSTKKLFRSQVSDGYFLRERLLGGSTVHSSELHRYMRALYDTHQVPSSEMLKHCRVVGFSRNAASTAAVTASCPPSPLPIADLGLRHAYLQLRAQHGVVLFLRWPLPTLGSESGGSGGFTVSAFASANEMEAKSATWPWWRLLRHIWGSCPWDRPVLHELLLSNAIRILAKRFGYANMAFTTAERFRERRDEETLAGSNKVAALVQGALVDPSKCSTDPDTVDVDGARCYVEAYVQQQEELLNLAHVGATVPAPLSNSVVVLTAADCEPPALKISGGKLNQPQLHWCVSQCWVTELRGFLASISGRKKGNESGQAVSSSSLQSKVRFPCSLCDRDKAAVFHLSLSYTSQHVPLSADNTTGAESTSTSAPAVAHTTLFSGTTFSPLSFFSPDYVLTRCVACGLSDYADGPLCRVCGGLLE